MHSMPFTSCVLAASFCILSIHIFKSIHTSSVYKSIHAGRGNDDDDGQPCPGVIFPDWLLVIGVCYS